MHTRRLLGWSLGLLSSFPSMVLAATTITYEAIDLTDTTAGEDRWQYRYTVSGDPFPQSFGFEVAFDAATVASIASAPAAPSTDWFVSTTQPMAGVPADGLYSAMALSANASLASPFEVSFIWSGPGNPGAQSFSILDGNFGLIETGTTAPIPEPQVYALMGVGLLVLLGRLRRVR